MKPTDYQCEQDAHHLMRAQEIMSDPKRHKAAKKHLDKMQKEKSQEAMHANAARGLQKAFSSETDANPDQQNSKASKPVMGQAAAVRGGTSKNSTITKVSAFPNLKGTSVGGY